MHECYKQEGGGRVPVRIAIWSCWNENVRGKNALDLVHLKTSLGPWTGSMGWSMDQVHRVVHGPRSMFCICPPRCHRRLAFAFGRLEKLTVFHIS